MCSLFVTIQFLQYATLGIQVSNRKTDQGTLRISGVTMFGPLEEKEATRGAIVSFISSLLNMVAVGFLQKRRKKKKSILDKYGSLHSC